MLPLRRSAPPSGAMTPIGASPATRCSSIARTGRKTAVERKNRSTAQTSPASVDSCRRPERSTQASARAAVSIPSSAKASAVGAQKNPTCGSDARAVLDRCHPAAPPHSVVERGESSDADAKASHSPSGDHEKGEVVLTGRHAHDLTDAVTHVSAVTRQPKRDVRQACRSRVPRLRGSKAARRLREAFFADSAQARCAKSDPERQGSDRPSAPMCTAIVEPSRPTTSTAAGQPLRRRGAQLPRHPGRCNPDSARAAEARPGGGCPATSTR